MVKLNKFVGYVERKLRRTNSDENEVRLKSYKSLSETNGQVVLAVNEAEKIDNPVKKSSKRDDLPNRSLLTLTRMGMVYFGIELLFSMEIALTVPIMLKLKVSEESYSYVFFVSPLIGVILQPILGVLSDRCQCAFGRRRPFILALAIGAFLGIAFILNGYEFGQYFGDQNLPKPYIAIVLVGLGVTLLDFSADSCDSPLRAYLLDISNTRDLDRGLNIHAFLGGLGSSLGFVLSAINWEMTGLKFIGSDSQIVFIFATIIFIPALISTLTSAKEKRFVIKKKDDKESKDISKCVKKTDKSPELMDDGDEPPIGLKTLFKSFLKMPKELVFLMICQILGWMALFSTELFFTDFIAQSIFDGDPAACVNSTEYKRYNDGVRQGSWCLLVFSLSSAISPIIFQKFLIKIFSTKTMFIITYFIYSISCIIIYFLHNLYAIFPFCSSFGILMTLLSTLPYQMISDFHQDSDYINHSPTETKRGIGIDCSLLSSCFFFSQAFISSFMGFLTAKYTNRVILIVGAIFGTIAFFFSLFFLKFPKENLSIEKSEVCENEKKPKVEISVVSK